MIKIDTNANILYPMIHPNSDIHVSTPLDRTGIGMSVNNEGVKIDSIVQVEQIFVSSKHSVIVTRAGILGSPLVDQRVSMASFFFFFSSRRRHTRFDCDWSSDVCSSD